MSFTEILIDIVSYFCSNRCKKFSFMKFGCQTACSQQVTCVGTYTILLNNFNGNI